MSEETGSWTYIATQHPNSKTPFLHFASRRFRSEARKELGEIHVATSSTMKVLSRASRRGQVHSERERIELEQALGHEQSRTSQMQGDLAKARQELQERDALIAALQGTGSSNSA